MRSFNTKDEKNIIYHLLSQALIFVEVISIIMLIQSHNHYPKPQALNVILTLLSWMLTKKRQLLSSQLTIHSSITNIQQLINYLRKEERSHYWVEKLVLNIFQETILKWSDTRQAQVLFNTQSQEHFVTIKKGMSQKHLLIYCLILLN